MRCTLLACAGGEGGGEQDGGEEGGGVAKEATMRFAFVVRAFWRDLSIPSSDRKKEVGTLMI